MEIHEPSPRVQVAEGIKTSLSVAPLTFSLALSFVAVAMESGLNPLEVVVWSAIAYAITSQIAILNAMPEGIGLFEAAVITFMTGVRISFISMSLYPFVSKVNKKILPFASFMICDASAGIIPAKAYAWKNKNISVFVFTCLLSLWLQMVIFNWLVVIIRPYIPVMWDKIFACMVPIVFISLVFLMIRSNIPNGLVIIITAAPLALFLTIFFSPQQAAIITALVASLVGVFLEGRAEPQ